MKMDNMLNNISSSITKDDIIAIMPEGLITGATLWIRLGGPRTKKELMKVLAMRPKVQTRARSGFMCGVALLISANRKKANEAGAGYGSDVASSDIKLTPMQALKCRPETDKMSDHLEVYKEYLEEFSASILSNKKRTEVIVHKEHGYAYKVMMPEDMANEGLCEWCLAAWPPTDTTITMGLELGFFEEASGTEVAAAHSRYNIPNHDKALKGA
jgi:hypothetical protein